MSATSLMSTYSQLPVSFEKGDGVWLWDTEGNRYLDALSGIAVCNLGHAHPAIGDAICEQSRQLIHTSNIYSIPKQEKLASALIDKSGMEKVFFANSGAEANEAAIKIARLYGHKTKGISEPTIIVMDNSFHGRTMATLSATGNRKVQAGFEPLVKGFVRAPYNDIESIKTIAANNRNIVAILVEPIQGEGGVHIPADSYLDELRTICDQHNWLLILDEIQTGMGRTGKWFAYQHSQIKPDVMTIAKALGNGVPIGACLARGRAAEVLQPGNHGSTFGGNPLACAAALAVIETIEKERVISVATTMSDYLTKGLKEALGGCATVVEIRHQGMMIGIELNYSCGELVQKALERGLLINVTADRVIRLLPPLTITTEQIDSVINTLSELIRQQ